jgi:hypothetical protein
MSVAARRTTLAVCILALLVGSVATPRTASADAAQFCRANMNMLLAPFDIVLSPFITAKDMYYGITEVDDEILIKIIAVPPGYLWLNTVQIGGGVIRFASGIFEFFPGMFTFFREGTTGPLFRSQDETWQMYNTDFGPCPFRFGTSYNTINEG